VCRSILFRLFASPSAVLVNKAGCLALVLPWILSCEALRLAALQLTYTGASCPRTRRLYELMVGLARRVTPWMWRRMPAIKCVAVEESSRQIIYFLCSGRERPTLSSRT